MAKLCHGNLPALSVDRTIGQVEMKAQA